MADPNKLDRNLNFCLACGTKLEQDVKYCNGCGKLVPKEISMQFVDAVVGNSSSGVIEAPSFKIPTVNIGDRQKGRIKAESVIDCAPKKEAIFSSIENIYTEEFKAFVKTVKNPYGEGCASEVVLKIIKEVDLSSLHKKSFYDILQRTEKVEV